MTTGDVNAMYLRMCEFTGTSPVTRRGVGDLIFELDTLGVVYARTRFYGMGGRTKDIELSVPRSSLEVLCEDELFAHLDEYRCHKQTTLM